MSYEPVKVGRARLIKKTDKSVLFRLFDYDGREEFIPNSHIHDDSPLHERSRIGEIDELVLTDFICEKRGLL